MLLLLQIENWQTDGNYDILEHKFTQLIRALGDSSIAPESFKPLI